MARQPWNIEWLNANSQRAYPFTEDATQQDTTGSLTIPDDFILGLYFPVHAGLNVETHKFFIRTINIFGTGYHIVLAYDDGTNSPPTVASAIIAKSTHKEYDQYQLVGEGDYADSVGQIILGRTETIDATASGAYTFDYAGTKLEVDCIRPAIQYLSAFRIVNGSEVSDDYYGDIELVAGTNMKLTATQSNNVTTIRIDAISGEGLNEVCACEETHTGPCISTINNLGPDATGNFTLLGGGCLTIDAIANGIRLVDTCAQPCCDCEELEALTRELEVFGSAEATVRTFVSNLRAEVTNMAQIVLGSRLGDDGCVAC